MSLSALLTAAARRWPDAPALTSGRHAITYRQLEASANALARTFAASGLVPGDRVAIASWNCPAMVEVMWAAFKAGICVVPINPRSVHTEVEYIVDDSEAKGLVFDASFNSSASALKRRDAALRLFPIGANEGLPAGHTAVSHDAIPLPGGAETRPEIPDEHLAWLFYTSGTTGRPKGAMLTHANLRYLVVSWLADIGLNATDVALHSTPLSHAAGFHALAVVASGGHNVILPGKRFDTSVLLRLIRDYRVTNLHLVPTQLRLLLNDAGIEHADLSSLRTLLYGAAPCPLPVLKAAIRRLGPNRMVQLYAQGEVPMTAAFLPREEHRLSGDDADERLQSVGYPRTGMRVRIVDPEGRPVPDGEVGEIAVSGPAVMAGYWRRPEATAEALRHGWLHTGDLGRFDIHGRLRLLDRMKDVVNSGGSNVYAAEVEQVLLTHPAVAEAAVIGVPDPKWGEAVVAVVVPEPDANRDRVPGDLAQHCQHRLADYKRPKRYDLVSELPVSSVGKVLKRELREQRS